MFTIANTLYYTSIFSVFIPIFFLLKNFRTAFIKVLGILIFASAFSDWGSFIIIKLGKSNFPITNTFILIQFLLLSYTYCLLFNNKKRIIHTILVLFIAFFIINTLFIESFNKYQSWSRFVGSIIIIIFAVNYYYQLLKTKIDLLTFSPFWLNTAVYFYFSFNLFLFAMVNYIMKNMTIEANMISWSFHSFNNIAKNILFAVAISYAGVKQKQKIDIDN